MKYVLIKALLVGSTVLDAHSSHGRQEMNPWLRSASGRYGSRGVVIESALVGGLLTVDISLSKHHHSQKWLAIAELATAGERIAVATHNYRQ